MAVSIGQGSFKGFDNVHVYNPPPGESNTLVSPDELISNNLQLISHNVVQMKQLVQNIGTDLDSHDLRNRVTEIQSMTNKLTKDTNLAIKMSANECPEDVQPAHWKLQQTRFKETFSEILRDYQDLQKKTRSKMQDNLRQSLVQSGVYNVEISQSGELTINGEQLQMETIQGEVDLDLIKERENDLKQIEQDILDINTIFKDLAKMVESQGEDIDEIEKNVVIAEKDVKEAVVQLQEADANVTSARSKKPFIMLIVVAIIVVIVIILIVLVT